MKYENMSFIFSIFVYILDFVIIIFSNILNIFLMKIEIDEK
jgi:hypothetical protein